MPDGERGYYTDVTPGHAHEQLIVQDLMALVDRSFPVRTDRGGRALGGFGMGGYGALKLALKYPQLFASVSSHAGACNLGHSIAPETDAKWRAQYLRLFGPNSKGGDNDIFALARRFAGEEWPNISIDCGSDDALLPENRTYHEHLERLGIEHQYSEFPGEHDWDYCDSRLTDALAFHWATLGV
jgi:S-formylglutathione hydrolase FrmB